MDNASPSREGALDPTRVHETAGGDTDFERELFTVYIEDCEERLGRLAKSVARRDKEGTRVEAHSIKGASLNVGTTRLHELALKLERTDPEASPKEAAAAYTALRTEFVRVRDAIRAYLAKQ